MDTPQIREQTVKPGLKVKGTNEYAIVTSDLLLGPITLEEFDNATTTNTDEPDAFKRALAYAERL